MSGVGLLHRHKTIDVRSVGDGRFVITVGFCDEDHDAGLEVCVEVASRRIVAASAVFRRAPYGERCAAVAGRAGRLLGLEVEPGCSRAVYRAVGGPEGCTHLVEMVMDALRAYLPALGRQEMLKVAAACRRAGLDGEEAQRRALQHIHRLGLRLLPDTCVVYRRGAGHTLPGAGAAGPAAPPEGRGSKEGPS
ncbi:MAG: DUF2889 domain-containing protein [Acetobacteraceae bacterium]|nr:DUF2889 domain-containing protein [Acetobacteraceae bacterium]